MPKPNKKKAEINNEKQYDTEENEKVYISMQNIFEQRAKKCINILKRFKKAGKLLDVGSSYGFYLKTFESFGYQSTGLEISKRAIDYSKNTLNLNVIGKTLEEYKFPKKKFDIITMFDVLEHFSNPTLSIIKIRKILDKNGLIIIQTPNYDSLISKLTSVKWFWLLIPQHLFLYSINTLRYFLKKNGFKILHVETWDDYHEFTSNILNLFGINYWDKTSFLHRILIKFKYALIPFAYFWNKFLLGGEILIYAKKE